MSRPTPVVQVAPWRDLDPHTLHDLLKLRIDVFVVEQRCAYAELDGRDVEPETRHVWAVDPGDPNGAPAAYLRVLRDSDGSLRVGRVCTRADARGAGLAGHLLRAVLDRAQGRPIVLAAQEHLAGWYRGYGFVVTGAGFLEDGIPHLPMRLDPVSVPPDPPARAGSAGTPEGAPGGR